MDEGKKSVLIHYVTDFILFAIGSGLIIRKCGERLLWVFISYLLKPSLLNHLYLFKKMKALYHNYFKRGSDGNPVIEVLKNVPIFENLTKKELSEVVRLTHERTYKKDENVFKKLSPAEGMYVILSGQVSIVDPDSETIFATLESGDFFGELALLDEEPRSASAVAKIPSRLIGFFRTDLLTLMKRSPELGNKILLNLSRVLGERLRRTNKELTKPNQ